jgi:hypothetical protein
MGVRCLFHHGFRIDVPNTREASDGEQILLLWHDARNLWHDCYQSGALRRWIPVEFIMLANVHGRGQYGVSFILVNGERRRECLCANQVGRPDSLQPAARRRTEGAAFYVPFGLFDHNLQLCCKLLNALEECDLQRVHHAANGRDQSDEGSG